MLEALRERMAAYLQEHRVCVLSTSGDLVTGDSWAMPVRYRSQGLEIDCLLPRWADMAYYLDQDSHEHSLTTPRAGPEHSQRACPEQGRRVMVVIQDAAAPARRWLQCQGSTRLVAQPDWKKLLPERAPSTIPPGDLYLVVRVTPERMDLLDESQGWGARETLEL